MEADSQRRIGGLVNDAAEMAGWLRRLREDLAVLTEITDEMYGANRQSPQAAALVDPRWYALESAIEMHDQLYRLIHGDEVD